MKRDGLQNSGVPLGGLGTGSVELRRDGYFHEWQMLNNAPWGAGPALDVPPDSAFLACTFRGISRARLTAARRCWACRSNTPIVFRCWAISLMILIICPGCATRK